MLYQPAYATPYLSSIDVTVSNIFSLQIQGNQCVAYRLKIFLLSNLTTAVYDTNKITLSSTLYGGETLEISVPGTGNGMTNGSEYVWNIQLYETISAIPISSTNYYFKAYKTPTLTISNFVSTINSKNYEFLGSYSQQQGVPIKYFIWNLYNGNDELLDTTGKINNSNIKYSFDGFLDGNFYKIELMTENQEGIISTTGKNQFDVSYFSPNTSTRAIAEVLNNKSAIKISWDSQSQIIGKSTGDYSILEDTPFVGAESVNVENGEIYWDLINESTPIFIPDQSTTMISVNFPIGFSGDIIELKDTINGTYYKVSCDGSFFYYNINGLLGTSDVYTEGDASFISDTLTINENKIYMWRDSYTWDNNKYWVSGTDILHKYFWKIILLPNQAIFYKVEV